MTRYVLATLFVFFLLIKVNSQIAITGCTLGGAMSNGKTSGCGLSPNPCDLASVYGYFGSFCGNTVVAASGGTVTVGTNLILPASCSATINIEMKQRPAIHPTGCNSGGMDAADAISITNSGGVITSQGATLTSGSACMAWPTLPGTATVAVSSLTSGCSNGDGLAVMVVTGGTVTISGTSDRGDEATTYTITLAGSGCGPSCNLVLPIDLLGFFGEKKESGVELKWNVASEINLSHYIIEKSVDAATWNFLVKVDPSAIPNSLQSYITFDTDPLKGINYYRLSNINTDGSVETHKIISVNYSNKSSNFYFTQTEEDVVISYNAFVNNNTLNFYDVMGRLIKKVKTENNNTISILKKELRKGLILVGCEELPQLGMSKVVIY